MAAVKDLKQASLPTYEEFCAVVNAAYDLERAIEKIASPIFKVINVEGEQEVTLEQIGALTANASELRTSLEITMGTLDKIEEATRDDLVTIGRNSQHVNMPTCDEYGTRNKYENEVARALATRAART
jgi:hypothetical protein